MTKDRGPRTRGRQPRKAQPGVASPGSHSSFAVGPSSTPGRAPSRLASFGYAFRGIGHLLATQRNAQIHCALGALAALLGLALGIERVEWVALVLTIALVLAAEGVNTAVEATVDLASPGFHPLAGVAKDVAAGTVLLTAIASVAVGALIFLPRLWPIVVRILGIAG